MKKQKIIPHLWFEKDAVEAAKFYVDTFNRSKINNISVIKNTPSGDVDLVEFQIFGYEFMAVSAGPYFTPNPSISFMINFDPSQDKDAKENIKRVWKKLSEEGKVLMPLAEYPFSKLYGWIEDRYGFSWQLIYTDPEGDERPLIIPSFSFAGDMYGKTKEATDFYLSIFKDSKRASLVNYPPGSEPNQSEALMFTDFKLEGQWFAAADTILDTEFQFNEAVSLLVNCKNQQEIDYYWEKLSAVAESEQCGWLKDKFGVSWQIVPENLNELMAKNPDAFNEKLFKMKKIIISDL